MNKFYRLLRKYVRKLLGIKPPPGIFCDEIGERKLPKGVRCIKCDPPPDYEARGFGIPEPMANRIRKEDP